VRELAKQGDNYTLRIYLHNNLFSDPLWNSRTKGGKASWTLQSIKRKNNINLLLQERVIKYVYMAESILWKTSSSVTLIPVKHLKIHHRVHKNPQTEYTLSKFKPVPTLRPYSIKIHFNNALVFMPSHTNGFPLFPCSALLVLSCVLHAPAIITCQI
jgi:hypothetical protein